MEGSSKDKVIDDVDVIKQVRAVTAALARELSKPLVPQNGELLVRGVKY